MSHPVDPVLNRLLSAGTCLTPGGVSAHHEVMATYRMSNGDAPFAFCRDGLLLDPEGTPRFVPFSEIVDAGYYNRGFVEGVKRRAVRKDPVIDRLPVVLADGEVLMLTVDQGATGISDAIAIAGLLQQRVVLHLPKDDMRD